MSDINVDVTLSGIDIQAEANLGVGINASAQIANVVEKMVDREAYEPPSYIKDWTVKSGDVDFVLQTKNKVMPEDLTIKNAYETYFGQTEFSIKDTDITIPSSRYKFDEDLIVHQGYPEYEGETNITVSEDVTLPTKDKILKSNITLHPFMLPIQLELIGTWSGTLAERTATSAQNTNTGINISNTEYLFFLATIECDGELDSESPNNWGGLTVCLGSRYTASNTGKYYSAGNIQYRGVKPKSYADVDSGDVNPITTTSYGVYGTNAQTNFLFSRRANATNCPKIMGGTYTVHVYGIRFG